MLRTVINWRDAGKESPPKRGSYLVRYYGGIIRRQTFNIWKGQCVFGGANVKSFVTHFALSSDITTVEVPDAG